MAEQKRSGGDPTEAATPKRIAEARRRGDVARSREVVSAALFIAVSVLIGATWPTMIQRLSQLIETWLTRAPLLVERRLGEPEPALAYAALTSGLDTFTFTLAPIIVVAVAVAVVSNFVQVGALVSFESIKPQLERINPLTNLKQVFGKRALAELIRSVIKIFGFAWITADAIWSYAPQLVGTIGQAPLSTLEVGADCMVTVSVRVGIFALLLAAFDLFYQHASHRKKLRMTKEEVKREHKEMEGDPQRKAERQRVHRELLEERMLDQIKTADCIVINPTHIAVALKYDAEKSDAPKVVARGQRLMASKIRQIARQHGIPIVRNVPLARALVELELDDEVPADLYEAVAEVLRFVYHLSGEDRQTSR